MHACACVCVTVCVKMSVSRVAIHIYKTTNVPLTAILYIMCVATLI